uniref:nephrocystin-4 isoform X1 n=2 Tax=Ciona intestinalis TaxID=7719 RepID=UPI000180BEA5|nr:nephrocystin-4 isoform X1 [Ciona intestinalis]|eukprot:XP_002122811.1 nephrocystin-4 isoform X1 [Ciona intestinalis]
MSLQLFQQLQNIHTEDRRKESQNKTWFTIINKWKDVDLHTDRVFGNTPQGYQFIIKQVTGNLTGGVEVYDTEYETRFTLFDLLHHKFIGRTWKGKPVKCSEGQSSNVSFNQPVYFHTSLLDNNILLVVEIVKIQTPKNPLPNDKPAKKLSCLGWGIVRLFKSGQQLKDVSELGDQAKKFDVYQGSPRALLYMEDPVESNPLIKSVPGCQVTFTLRKHFALSPVIHLMPDNVLFGSDERVPGMLNIAVKSGPVVDYYLKANSLKPCVGYIDKLTINLGMRIDKFEEELCRRCNEDRMRKDDMTDDGKTVIVSERRLMIGAHNGFCYIQKPQYVHVEPEAVIGGARVGSFRGKRKDNSSVSSPSGSMNLVLRSRVQLNEMLPDPHIAIVMQLEYVLAVPHSGYGNVTGSMSSLRSQPVTVMLRWAAWCPYTMQRLPQEPITVVLKGGMSSNPDKLYFYKLIKNEEGEVKNGSVKFCYLTSDEPPQPSISSKSTTVSPEMRPSKQNPLENNFSVTQDNTYNVEITHLEAEDHVHPVHAPPILPIAQSVPALSRASYARLYTSGFPDIMDRSNSPAQVVDASDPMFRPAINNDITDVLQTNEIIIQFLAFSHPVPASSEAPPPPIHSIFFSFQFYRFHPVSTQRMSIIRKPDIEGNPQAPCVLRKIESGEKLDEGRPGLEIKYYVDPVHMKPGDNATFLKYLSTHNLHVDVWDGDSLMLLGSLSVPLKHLMRGGKPAVCVNHELDIVHSEHSDVAPTFTGDLNSSGSVRPLGLVKTHRGKLHLRLGNVGFPSESKSSVSSVVKKNHLVVADLSGCGFQGGSLASALQQSNINRKYVNRCKVKKLAESNQELSELLLMNVKKDDALGKENTSDVEQDADRKRKIARMIAVRNMEQPREEGSIINKPSIGQRALQNNQERSLKQRDLHTVATYRYRLKSEHIMEMLLLSITTKHTIRPTLGSAEFVELQLKNPFSVQQTVTIECDNPELRVITDTREWRYFKSLAGLHTPVEENMFNFDPNTSLPQVFLRPKEKVYIPFRYQGYEADHTVSPQGAGHHFKATKTSLQPSKQQNNHGTIKAKIIKAVLRTMDGRPLSVLQLSIDPQPHVVDQTFRFYNPEQTFMKKRFRLPPFNVNTDEQFHVVCSDQEIVCQARSLNRDEPREIFIKAPSGSSPTVRRFYLAIYNDPFLAIPAQIWSFYVHALQRVDVNCVLGQTSRFSLVLRGTQTARMVQCFASHKQEMQLAPDEAFLLPANGVHEINVGVRTTSTTRSSKHMYVNVVDTEYHQLIRTWLVAVKTREPMITKEFDIELPRSGGKACNKVISYTNPYPNIKKFHLMTSRSDLLHFRDVEMELGPGETTSIGLRFASGVKQSGKFPVHIFINDVDDKNEETFLVNVTYV